MCIQTGISVQAYHLHAMCFRGPSGVTKFTVVSTLYCNKVMQSTILIELPMSLCVCGHTVYAHMYYKIYKYIYTF